MATDVSKVSIFGKDCIHLGFHLFKHVAQTVVSHLPASTYAIVTDTIIAKLYLEALQANFQTALSQTASSRVITYAIAPGEQSKSRQGKAEVEDFLLAQRCTRDTVIIALGGGVVGDLVGFVAATFMRGVRFVQVPTTLLAMVDSAVGGKTAIDVPLGKNLIGAFHQPEFIFIDAAVLETLPPREFENGMAEVIKTAAIWNAEEFDKLEAGVESIRAAVLTGSRDQSNLRQSFATRSHSQKLLLDVIKGSINVKAHIVTIDEKETGLRNLVNFGHTVGHALEAILTPHILHGECVAIGMVLEAEIARALGHLSNAAVARLVRCLVSHGLPVSVRDPRIAKSPNAAELNVEQLLDVMRVDKKNAGATKKVVLLSRIGKTVEERASGVPDEIIARILAPAIRVTPTVGADRSRSVVVQTPGSKSISNRVLVLAALASGTTRIINLLHSDDTQVMMTALQEMNGASFAWEDDGEVLVVRGGGGQLKAPPSGKAIYLGNAGTAARFLTAVTTLSQGQERITLTGNARMKQRPIAPLMDALMANGCDLQSTEQLGCMPLSIAPTGLRGGRISLSASLSSQYVSAILLAAPYAKETVELELVGDEVVSQLYIDMTVALMHDFGVTVERVGERTYRIPRAAYASRDSYTVESDASSATYPLAIAAITGSSCTIPNIGSTSLQGDARFARDVLEPMGCQVEQTLSSTTVSGPSIGKLRALPKINMEPMTDAFMTATVLAAVADNAGTTRITGIANQRVKECNRIEAMRVQLAKLGVTVRELPDGLEVDGIHPSQLGLRPLRSDGTYLMNGAAHRPDVRIHCYDDHRIAMAFSVLAAVPGGPGAVIEDKRCVEKTWPSWWDDLARKIGGVSLSGVDVPSGAAPAVSKSRYPIDASIILVGMRGAGKSYTGNIGAMALGRPLIDADLYFEERMGVSVREYVHQNSWSAFRQQELACCKELLQQYATGHVIAMGGGIIETPEAFALLQRFSAQCGPVVNVMRDIQDIVTYLGTEVSRPNLGEPIEVIAARRAPLLVACSNYDFHSWTAPNTPQKMSTTAMRGVVRAPDSMQGSINSVNRFFRFISGQDCNQPALTTDQRRTYFLPLTFPDLVPALSLVEQLSVGVDALELRADLLQPSASPLISYAGMQLAALRQHTSLPIIFTVRTQSQGGKFPDAEVAHYFELLHQAVRWGCEYIDLQLGADLERSKTLLGSKGRSMIVASYHDWTGQLKWDSTAMRDIHRRLLPFADIIKICATAGDMRDNFEMMAFRDRVQGDKPLLTLNMGLVGQMSRILNPVFSPVTHPLLPPSAPGQLSFSQTMQALHLLGQMPARRFYLFGKPIAQSKSPLIHNSAFEMLGLPHRYELHEAATVGDALTRIIRSPHFGGASVTIPLKLDILPLLDELSAEVETIGACNTIVPRMAADGTISLVGHNTDATGLRDLLARALLPAHAVTAHSCGLVLGAGGTSRAAIWALHALGLKRLFLYNRTTASAEALIQAFPSTYNICLTNSLDPSVFGSESPVVIISTVPGEATQTVSAPSASAGILLHDNLLSRLRGGVVLDAAYRPKRTPLIQLGEAAREQGWLAIPGIYMLLEQAFHQSELWTGRKVARSVIEKVVLDAYDVENPQ